MLSAPFLKRITLDPLKTDRETFPFTTLPYLAGEFELAFETAVTIIVGENGSGKSTLIDAIAQMAGFAGKGGSQDHQTGEGSQETALAKALRPSWLPRVRRGFFFRAASFFSYVDYLSETGGFGNLKQRSHGEAFLETFQDRMQAEQRAIYILDEPEVALSPQRQLAFLRILREWQLSGQVQAIIATHSPILMSLPDATLLSLDDGAIRPIALEETKHYRITKSFLGNPTAFLADLFRDLG